jgi:hypothetical protein
MEGRRGVNNFEMRSRNSETPSTFFCCRSPAPRRAPPPGVGAAVGGGGGAGVGDTDGVGVVGDAVGARVPGAIIP